MVTITFLSHAASDKTMVWLLINAVFIGAYVHITQKDTILKHVDAVWKRVMEKIGGLIEKIPKYKSA